MSYWKDEKRGKLLQELYPSATREEVLEAFPEKNWNSIAGAAWRRGIKRRVPHRSGKKSYPVMSEKTREIMAWAVALEGSIMLHKQIHYTKGGTIGLYPGIAIGNTDFRLLEKIIDMTGHGHCSRTNWNSGTNSKPVRKWEMRNIKELHSFLSQVIDYLPSKAEQAKLLLEYLESRLSRWRLPYTKRDFEIQELISKLNKRGMK